MARRLLAVLLFALFASAVAGAAARAEPAVEHTVLGYRGQVAPDTPPGATFWGLGNATLNASGTVVLEASVLPATGNSLRGIWKYQAGGLDLVRLIETQAPGIPPGGLFWIVNSPLFLTDAGGLGFHALLERDTGDVTYDNDVGLWGPAPDGSLALLVREGDPAPGLPGVFGGSFNYAGVGESGTVFADSVRAPDGSVLGYGVFAAEASPTGPAHRTILFAGDPMPGGPEGTVFVSTPRPAMNQQGEVAIRAHYDTPTESDLRGIWGPGADGSLVPLALEGEAIPGEPTGTFDGSFGVPRLNEMGEVAFTTWAGVFGPDGTGGLRLIVSSSEEAPGVPGARIVSFDWPVLSEAGEVAFRGRLWLLSPGVSEDDDEAIWGPDGRGGVRLIVREGDPAPGLPGYYLRELSWPHLNLHGDVAFRATLYQGPEPDAPSYWYAVYFATRAGHFFPVLTGLESLEVAPGVFEPVGNLPTLREAFNYPNAPALNDARQLAISSGNMVVRTRVRLGKCQDGLDNDGDGRIDWDGAASFHGGIAIAEPDGRCGGDPDAPREASYGCGLGFELALVRALLTAARGRRRGSRARGQG